MPAYEPGGHQASDSLYDQVTSAQPRSLEWVRKRV